MTAFETLKEIIRTRRSIKPTAMNGQHIPDSIITEILKTADWAPTHGRTEPWRFYVYGPQQVKHFCENHAQICLNNKSGLVFDPEKIARIKQQGDRVSHIVLVAMQRTPQTKIPLVEELAATATAVGYILLQATALGISSLWSTGGCILKDDMKEYLKLSAEDQILGALFLGYTDAEAQDGKRNIAIEEKIKWMP